MNITVKSNEYNFYQYKNTDVGFEKFWRGINAPDGWLIENGQILKRVEYLNLFRYAVDNNFIVEEELWNSQKLYGMFSYGDNSETFRIPDLRGRFMRSYYQGVTKDLGQACSAGLPDLWGALWLGAGAYFGGCNGVFASLSGGCNEDPNTGNWGQGTVSFLASNCNPIYGASNEVTPQYVAFNSIIKY